MPAKNRTKRYKLSGRNICEFHKDTTGQILRCEGYDDLSASGFFWGNKADKKRWQKKHCEKMGEGCPYRKSLLLTKYNVIKNPERAVEILRAFKRQFPDDEIEELCDILISLIK